MKSEIGSEFEFNFEDIMSREKNNLNGQFQTSDYILVSSGRCGIKQVLLNLKNTNDTTKTEYLLPAYLCPSIKQPFDELHLKIVYYNVNEDLSIDIDDLLHKVTKQTKAIYFINYFGMIPSDAVTAVLLEIQRSGVFLIEDITHNFFSKRLDIGDYLIASLRKWGPLPHGGVVIVNKNKDLYNTWYEDSVLALKIGQIRAFALQLKHMYLQEIHDERIKDKYLNLLHETDQDLYSHIEIVPMDELSANMLERMDFDELSKKRRANYQYLYHHLQHIREIRIVVGDIQDSITPLGFHIVLENRDELRNYLVKKNVYSSIHWILPSEVIKYFERPNRLSHQLLTIPCDQRYDAEDMEYIVQVIKSYFESKRLEKEKSFIEVGEDL